jgi:DNA repair photolyase
VTRAYNLADRFRRVNDGEIFSAVDEFLQRRVPLQFGGMTDPFSKFEEQRKSSLALIGVLADNQYPTLISTKSTTPATPEYADLLSSGNFLVRFSCSIISDVQRGKIESGVPKPTDLLRTVETLANRGIPCAVRFQPIIPGHESHAFELATAASNAGASHVTYEYLKLPSDDTRSKIARLATKSGQQLIDYYRESGSTQQGREFILPSGKRITFLSEISEYARKIGLTVGLGDNEFLPYSDGQSCCNGADLYLRDTNPFSANPAGVIRKKKKGDAIRFGDVLEEWMPLESVNPYLNSRVRSRPGPHENGWHSILKARWRAGTIYGPDFFHGVRFDDRFDEDGMPIFVKTTETLLPL